MWWTWTPNVTTNALLDTTGSAFDTVLAVYTGNNLATLNPVASTNDVGSRKQAYLNLPVSAGTTYRIAVAAASTNIVGSLLLRITP